VSRRGGRRADPRGGSGGGPRGGPGAVLVAGIAFRRDELRDLAAAWLALSVAFAILFAGGGSGMGGLLAGDPLGALSLLVVSLLTAGAGFMVHELAHKVVAVRFGQAAAFRANYQMLGVAVLASLAGFIFAAPGAVHHAGRITDRERGLVALAGPVSNVLLAALFVVPLVLGVTGSSVLARVGGYGIAINLLLAGFNMLPFGPLDGATVRRWSTVVYLAVAVPCILLGLVGFLFIP